MRDMAESYSVLITDVDNTLFDWFGVWHASFRAMLDQIVLISGINEEILIPEIKKIHQSHMTSEYAFLIEEIPSLQQKYSGANLLEIFDPAIQAYRAARRAKLTLYDGVADTLIELKRRGVLIMAYTESQAFYTSYRFQKLNLDGLVDFLFSPPDHEVPNNTTRMSIRSKPARSYDLLHTQRRETPKGEMKPNPTLLKDIISSVGADRSQVIYVGDSRFKDVAMAQDAGVMDVLANYGESHRKEEYKLLVDVTHWSDEDVEREKKMTERDIRPTVKIGEFSVILNLFRFDRFVSKNG